MTFASLLEVLGLGVVVTGAWLFDYRLGLIALGVVLVLISLGLSRSEPRS